MEQTDNGPDRAFNLDKWIPDSRLMSPFSSGACTVKDSFVFQENTTQFKFKTGGVSGSPYFHSVVVFYKLLWSFVLVICIFVAESFEYNYF